MKCTNLHNGITDKINDDGTRLCCHGCADLHDDITENIDNFVNEKVNKKHIIYAISETSTDFVLRQLIMLSDSKSTGFDCT